MDENREENGQQTESRSHALALMRFFSIDTVSEMNIQSASIQVPEISNLCRKEFIFKVIQLILGFVCVAIYPESLKLLADSTSTMMFPNIVFSSFIIITSVITFSILFGCAMPEVQTRIFDVLGMILYFASGSVTTYECAVRRTDRADAIDLQRKYLLATSVVSYMNTFMYGIGVYFSVNKALGSEIKLQSV